MLSPDSPNNQSPYVPPQLGRPTRVPDARSLEQREHQLIVPPKLDQHVFTHPVALSEGALFMPNHTLIQDHVAHWIKNPDKGSVFARKTRLLRWLPRTALFKLLQIGRYDGLIFFQPGEVIAHVFFQRHGSDLHMFSVAVAPAHRGNGYAEQALRCFIEHARARPGISRVRLGAKGHDAVERICTKIENTPDEYRLGVDPNRFYRLLRN